MLTSGLVSGVNDNDSSESLLLLDVIEEGFFDFVFEDDPEGLVLACFFFSCARSRDEEEEAEGPERENKMLGASDVSVAGLSSAGLPKARSWFGSEDDSSSDAGTCVLDDGSVVVMDARRWDSGGA